MSNAEIVARVTLLTEQIEREARAGGNYGEIRKTIAARYRVALTKQIHYPIPGGRS